MSYANIVFEPSGDGIATLTINRPEKLNALNAETLREFRAALEQWETDPSQRALIVTGSGEKAFAAGADIEELFTESPAGAREFALRGQRLFRRLETVGKPSLAAINGFALGGGLELAMACTVRVASDNAKLGQPEVKLGTIPGYGGTQRLPRLVGRARALEMILTGDPIEAAEAHRIGLVNHVVPRAELISFSRGLLARMLSSGPLATALAMDAVDTGLDAPIEEGLRYEASGFGLAAATEDWREGMRAFLEKRKAVFKGK